MEVYIFGFPCCSTREDLSIDVSITNVGLDIDEAKVISALRHKSKFEFRTLKKIKFEKSTVYMVSIEKKNYLFLWKTFTIVKFNEQKYVENYI